MPAKLLQSCLCNSMDCSPPGERLLLKNIFHFMNIQESDYSLISGHFCCFQFRLTAAVKLPLISANTCWRRQWHPIPVLLPGKSMDGGAWWAAVHGVARSQTRLSDFTFTFTHWRRKWQRTPVFLLRESQGHGSLVGCHLWGLTESDTTEAT